MLAFTLSVRVRMVPVNTPDSSRVKLPMVAMVFLLVPTKPRHCGLDGVEAAPPAAGMHPAPQGRAAAKAKGGQSRLSCLARKAQGEARSRGRKPATPLLTQGARC